MCDIMGGITNLYKINVNWTLVTTGCRFQDDSVIRWKIFEIKSHEFYTKNYIMVGNNNFQYSKLYMTLFCPIYVLIFAIIR